MNSPDCCLQCPEEKTEVRDSTAYFNRCTGIQYLRYVYFTIQPGFHLQFHASFSYYNLPALYSFCEAARAFAAEEPLLNLCSRT